VYTLVAVHNLINRFYLVGDNYKCFQPTKGEETKALKQETNVDKSPRELEINKRRDRIADLL
jgi:hypothetical protein